MQMDLRTVAIAPRRQTFGHVARRLGADKSASRYQEGTWDMQSTGNFHYKPLWDPDFDHFDPARTELHMKDWYAFRDPRQFYYGAYVIARSKQQDVAESAFDFVETRGLAETLPKDIRALVLDLLLPLRHVAWGASMNNATIAAYGFGAGITQPCTFAAMDQLGIAQFITRAGLLLADPAALDTAKAAWLNDACWQPLRRVIEDLFVTQDWFELFVAQNVVLDGLLYPLIYRTIIDDGLTMRGGSAVAMLTQFQTEWAAETAKWADAQVKVAVAESADNAKLVTGWLAKWRDRIIPALMPVAQLALGSHADAALAEVADQWASRLVKQGVKL